MDKPTFILEGIGGVYNYGCEALVRGTTAILRHAWPHAKVVYHSYRPGPDRDALADLNVIVADGTAPRGPFRRFAKRLRSRLGLPSQGDAWRYRWAKKAHCVVAIGGDILTLWPNQGDAKEFPQATHLNRVVEQGAPVVLWGASVGPFDDNPHALPAFLEPLKKLKLITARETLTRDYLASHQVEDRVALVADPAFLMTPCDDDDPAVVQHGPRPGRRTLGVNLSPLSADYVAGQRDRGTMRRSHAAAIARMIENHDTDVLLIPHVVCPWRADDDDLGYLEKLAAEIPAPQAQRVRVLPPGLGARRTKGIVSRCDALIAARMHCAIAGMSTGVPTLLLSYSPKAVGMCEYIHGHREMALPLDAGEESLLAAVGRTFEQAPQLRRHLQQRMPAVREDALNGGNLLKHALSNGR